MKKFVILFLIFTFLFCVQSLVTYNVFKNNDKIQNENNKLIEENVSLQDRLVWDEKLKNKLNIVVSRTPAVGGFITSTKKNIDKGDTKNVDQSIDAIPTTDNEILMKEDLLKHGLNLYNTTYDFFRLPFRDKYKTFITSEYGWGWIEYEDDWGRYRREFRLHCGVDGVSKLNLEVLSMADGKVYITYYDKIFGNVIRVYHEIDGESYVTCYCHLSTIKVKTKQKVKQGEPIAVMGNTGDSHGIHLHFEIWKLVKGKWLTVNPFVNTTYNVPVEIENYKSIILR